MKVCNHDRQVKSTPVSDGCNAIVHYCCEQCGFSWCSVAETRKPKLHPLQVEVQR